VASFTPCSPSPVRVFCPPLYALFLCQVRLFAVARLPAGTSGSAFPRHFCVTLSAALGRYRQVRLIWSFPKGCSLGLQPPGDFPLPPSLTHSQTQCHRNSRHLCQDVLLAPPYLAPAACSPSWIQLLGSGEGPAGTSFPASPLSSQLSLPTLTFAGCSPYAYPFLANDNGTKLCFSLDNSATYVPFFLFLRFRSPTLGLDPIRFLVFFLFRSIHGPRFRSPSVSFIPTHDNLPWISICATTYPPHVCIVLPSLIPPVPCDALLEVPQWRFPLVSISSFIAFLTVYVTCSPNLLAGVLLLSFLVLRFA